MSKRPLGNTIETQKRDVGVRVHSRLAARCSAVTSCLESVPVLRALDRRARAFGSRFWLSRSPRGGGGGGGGGVGGGGGDGGGAGSGNLRATRTGLETIYPKVIGTYSDRNRHDYLLGKAGIRNIRSRE